MTQYLMSVRFDNDIDALADTHTCRFTPAETVGHVEITRQRSTRTGGTD